MNSAILRLALIGGAALAAGGCTTDGYGGYGYTGLSYGYASPYYGWYDDYYYPGTGYYVYERSGARHHWSDSQRRYWESRRGGGHRQGNWSGYHRDRDGDGSRDAGHWSGRRDGDRDRDHRGGHDGHRGGHGSGGNGSHGGHRSNDSDGHHHRR